MSPAATTTTALPDLLPVTLAGARPPTASPDTEHAAAANTAIAAARNVVAVCRRGTAPPGHGQSPIGSTARLGPSQHSWCGRRVLATVAGQVPAAGRYGRCPALSKLPRPTAHPCPSANQLSG